MLTRDRIEIRLMLPCFAKEFQCAAPILGFLGICASAVLALERLWVISALVFVAAGLVDSLDGLVARHQGRVTAFGAFLDSTLDRTGENLVLAGIAYGAAVAGYPVIAGLGITHRGQL